MATSGTLLTYRQSSAEGTSVKTVGYLHRVEGKIYSHIGTVNGITIVAYPEKIRGIGKLRIMEPENHDLKALAGELTPQELHRQPLLKRKIRASTPDQNQLNLI
jgi:hypothetical protein